MNGQIHNTVNFLKLSLNKSTNLRKAFFSLKRCNMTYHVHCDVMWSSDKKTHKHCSVTYYYIRDATRCWRYLCKAEDQFRLEIDSNCSENTVTWSEGCITCIQRIGKKSNIHYWRRKNTCYPIINSIIKND